MNYKVLLKLIVCDVAMLLLVLGYSTLLPLGTDLTDIGNRDFMIYQFIFGQMITTVVFALLVTAYTWASFQTAKSCRRWHLVMVLNAAITMAVGVGAGLLMASYIPWHLSAAISWAKIMLWVGPVTIVLSFPLRLLKRKGLVA